MISAIILAAGMSKRMGRPKQLLRLGGKTMIRIIAENVVASKVDEVLVVTGCQGDSVAAEVSGLPVKVVHNPDFAEGQGVSLALGARNISKDASAILVLTSDQPLVSSSLINFLVEKFKKSSCLALRPVYNGMPGHPVIFSGFLREELVGLKGDEGARQILKKMGGGVNYWPVQDEAVVFDIDTPEDFETLRKRLNLL
ncbi:MAG: nucleotidyltransferase family protein [Pelotomaculum sp.]|uniref:Uncharacterized MobA-related protein n=1 Tax=Pelotomaculum thermopropionicum (strain DSM 13744 / JCM 10971 / SI) TaxID=370438 RepID=A5D216_PELTS|nr:nucleotidyltransferase family protein [Pelotomaculum sp.]BAF59713.1 Uncharacterized MobA-related protein [Pelotomaculum thermopropionicum SI]